LGISANVLRYVAIALIAVFGLILFLPKLSNWFASATGSLADVGAKVQAISQGQKPGFVSGFFIGSALGLVWTPCAGPILAAITTLVATQQVSWQIVVLTVSYSLGAGVPLLLIAFGGHRLVTSSPWLSSHTESIRRLFGAVMLLTAAALAFQWDVLFQQMVLDYLPSFNVENHPLVKKELEHLRGPSRFSPSVIQSKERKTGDLPVLGQAPPIIGISAWINTSPLTLEQLKGKVVLVDFWTYSCINCIRTFPYLRKWYDKYHDRGLVIIGVHTPEFEFEKDENNVRGAVKRFEIKYPVALDNQYQTWQSFSNFYWPAHYLIDQEGDVREIHFGEGGYQETENAIRSLLNLPPLLVKEEKEEAAPIMQGMTPETYLGYKRAEAYVAENRIVKDAAASYGYHQPVGSNEVALQGMWTIGEESILSQSDSSRLTINFKADRVHLVLGGVSSKPIQVELDGHPLPEKYRTEDMNGKGEIIVHEPRKYDIVDLKGEDGRHLLTIQIPQGVEVYAFTFGAE
jgi:thiol-disulfide isomerase/thioredoxin